MFAFQLDTGGQIPINTSTPFQQCHKGLEETPENGLSSPVQLDTSYDDTWNMTENISTLQMPRAP